MQEVRNSVLKFHKNLRVYVESYLPNQNEMGQSGITKLLAMIDDHSIDNSNFKQTAALVDESAYELLLMEAEMALETGDERKCKDACYQVLQTFGV